MRWSNLLIATLRDNPQDAEIDSHKLMVRSGLIRKLSGGLYTFMPLGSRALRKVMNIVREEMDKAGAVEILMPALQPAELWEQSGRWTTMGPGMFRLQDRQQRRMALGPTHEEVVSELISNEINSYRQLPCTVYQIQTKFRDEIRPRFGLMRSKEFIMKDAYSFDTSFEAADKSYLAMYNAYKRIFKRCGLDAHPVEADTGDIGGKWSHEFHVLADSGEDGIAACPGCGYAANLERAERKVREAAAPETACPETEEIATPGVHTIDELVRFLKCKPKQLVKTLIYLVDGSPVAVMVPGDRDVNDVKLRRVLGAKKAELADDATVVKVTGAPVGFAGPKGLAVPVPVYADQSLKGATDRIAGANKADTHLLHVDIARDAQVKEFIDVVTVKSHDLCPHCGKEIEIRRGIEVGHVFKLGTKYTEAFDAKYLDENGQPQLMVMGCYGIGVTRTLQASVEANHDANGIIWPVSIAPAQVALLSLDVHDEEVGKIVDSLEKELEAEGIDVVVDDRDERPGVKFKDADLIGFPLRVVVGAKSLAKGGVEIKERTAKDCAIIPVADTVTEIRKRLAAMREALEA